MSPAAKAFGEQVRALLRTDLADRLTPAELLQVVGLEAGLLVAEVAATDQLPVDEVRAIMEAQVDRAIAHTAVAGFRAPD